MTKREIRERAQALLPDGWTVEKLYPEADVTYVGVKAECMGPDDELWDFPLLVAGPDGLLRWIDPITRERRNSPFGDSA